MYTRKTLKSQLLGDNLLNLSPDICDEWKRRKIKVSCRSESFAFETVRSENFKLLYAKLMWIYHSLVVFAKFQISVSFKVIFDYSWMTLREELIWQIEEWNSLKYGDGILLLTSSRVEKYRLPHRMNMVMNHWRLWLSILGRIWCNSVDIIELKARKGSEY